MASTAQQANKPPEKRKCQEKKDLMSLLEDVVHVSAEDTTLYGEGEAKKEIQSICSSMQPQITH